MFLKEERLTDQKPIYSEKQIDKYEWIGDREWKLHIFP